MSNASTVSSGFNHFLSPRAELVDEKELSKLLKKYGVDKQQLPRILASDPAAVALNAEPGAVIKFCRKNAVSGKEEAYYRLVVA